LTARPLFDFVVFGNGFSVTGVVVVVVFLVLRR
jgi:hypothetical protein